MFTFTALQFTATAAITAHNQHILVNEALRARGARANGCICPSLWCMSLKLHCRAPTAPPRGLSALRARIAIGTTPANRSTTGYEFYKTATTTPEPFIRRFPPRTTNIGCCSLSARHAESLGSLRDDVVRFSPAGPTPTSNVPI